jgi:hypothetical protein
VHGTLRTFKLKNAATRKNALMPDNGGDSALPNTSVVRSIHCKKVLRARWVSIDGIGLRCVWIVEREVERDADAREQTDT